MSQNFLKNPKVFKQCATTLLDGRSDQIEVYNGLALLVVSATMDEYRLRAGGPLEHGRRTALRQLYQQTGVLHGEIATRNVDPQEPLGGIEGLDELRRALMLFHKLQLAHSLDYYTIRRNTPAFFIPADEDVWTPNRDLSIGRVAFLLGYIRHACTRMSQCMDISIE